MRYGADHTSNVDGQKAKTPYFVKKKKVTFLKLNPYFQDKGIG